MPDLAPSLACARPACAPTSAIRPGGQGLPEAARRVLQRTAQMFAASPDDLQSGGAAWRQVRRGQRALPQTGLKST
jgi:hypothetical protein